MDDNNEKRMISDTGYEVRQAFCIGGKELLLAENQDAENGQFYLVCTYIDHGIIGEYKQAMTSDDYLEVVRNFSERISKETAEIEAERGAQNLPVDLFTAEDCYPHSYSESIEGKVVAIRPSVLSPEYRRGDMQLVLVSRGNGAGADPMGSAVYCYHLNSGVHTRFERNEVLGIVKELPDWANESLARLQGELDKPLEEKQYAGNYEIIERIEAGQKVFALGYSEKAVLPYGTWQGSKHCEGFDWGHYFDSHEAAKDDLHDRAAAEQERAARTQRSSEAR